ncbi:hypothetical protein HPB47_015037 [Ixodes persulcatus]|uniref:Uncharacterized protein n=1 Tax=Ixodes persulcatus TaxID=34615 RepID=A0AC60QUJ1_IXOPE|nr:hypothetical protein HPB47_015037 [Ixodes persulcatus]
MPATFRSKPSPFKFGGRKRFSKRRGSGRPPKEDDGSASSPIPSAPPSPSALESPIASLPPAERHLEPSASASSLPVDSGNRRKCRAKQPSRTMGTARATSLALQENWLSRNPGRGHDMRALPGEAAFSEDEDSQSFFSVPTELVESRPTTRPRRGGLCHCEFCPYSTRSSTVYQLVSERIQEPKSAGLAMGVIKVEGEGFSCRGTLNEHSSKEDWWQQEQHQLRDEGSRDSEEGRQPAQYAEMERKMAT